MGDDYHSLVPFKDIIAEMFFVYFLGLLDFLFGHYLPF